MVFFFKKNKVIIALRIWLLSSSKGDRRISSITPMILESGALYSIILIILLLLLATKSWFQYVLIEAVRILYFFPLAIDYSANLDSSNQLPSIIVSLQL